MMSRQMKATRTGCIVAAMLMVVTAVGLGDAQASQRARKNQPVADKARTETWPVCGLKTTMQVRVQGRGGTAHRSVPLR